jgi:hypothetical protein
MIETFHTPSRLKSCISCSQDLPAIRQYVAAICSKLDYLCQQHHYAPLYGVSQGNTSRMAGIPYSLSIRILQEVLKIYRSFQQYGSICIPLLHWLCQQHCYVCLQRLSQKLQRWSGRLPKIWSALSLISVELWS